MFTMNEIGARIRAEDNRATAIPIYVVQRRRRTYGFDPDYADGTDVWIDCEGNEADADERKPLDEAYELGNDAPDDWKRTAYQDTWEYVMPFFTEAAAQRYMDENRHNLRPECRIFVESGYRNAEWDALRKFLAGLPAPATADIDARARRHFKPPFRFEQGYIWDADGEMVADDRPEMDDPPQADAVLRVRGWGRMKYEKDSEELYQAVGRAIAEALTRGWNQGDKRP